MRESVIRKAFERAATNPQWEDEMYKAASGGNVALVKFYHERGAVNYQPCLKIASVNGHREVIIYLLQLERDGLIALQSVLWGIIKGGRDELFDEFFARITHPSRSDISGCFVKAAKYGRVKIMEKMYRMGGNLFTEYDFNQAKWKAKEMDHKHVITMIDRMIQLIP